MGGKGDEGEEEKDREEIRKYDGKKMKRERKREGKEKYIMFPFLLRRNLTLFTERLFDLPMIRDLLIRLLPGVSRLSRSIRGSSPL